MLARDKLRLAGTVTSRSYREALAGIRNWKSLTCHLTKSSVTIPPVTGLSDSLLSCIIFLHIQLGIPETGVIVSVPRAFAQHLDLLVLAFSPPNKAGL